MPGATLEVTGKPPKQPQASRRRRATEGGGASWARQRRVLARPTVLLSGRGWAVQGPWVRPTMIRVANCLRATIVHCTCIQLFLSDGVRDPNRSDASDVA